VGELARRHGGHRALLIADPGVAAAGHAERIREVLEAADLTVLVWDRVRENPTNRDIVACVELAASSGIDLIVGLGGGSALDTAKGCNFLLSNGGRMQDYRGFGKATKPMLPLIAIPTTTGTGSECQSYAIITDEDTHHKMACGDPGALPRVAVLDPLLTTTQPRQVTAFSGLDAITHAVEVVVTRRRTPLSSMLAYEAFALLESSLPVALEHPQDLPARGRMLLGAAWAGLAIEHSMLGAAHAAANPLTARYSITHGEAVAMMLPAVVGFNAEDRDARAAYAALAARAGLTGHEGDEHAGLEALQRRLGTLLDLAGLPRSLGAYGVSEDAISGLASEAATQWTGTFNPRPVAALEFDLLYRRTLHDAR
jgi:alcohol dehydrogenase